MLDAILNNSKRSIMPAGHHSDSDSTLLPLPKSPITWFMGIFARLPPLAAGLHTILRRLKPPKCFFCGKHEDSAYHLNDDVSRGGLSYDD